MRKHRSHRPGVCCCCCCQQLALLPLVLLLHPHKTGEKLLCRLLLLLEAYQTGAVTENHKT